MEFGLSEEQVMLQDALARFLTGTGGLERARAFAAGKDRRAPDVLQGLAELGVTGLIIRMDSVELLLAVEPHRRHRIAIDGRLHARR